MSDYYDSGGMSAIDVLRAKLTPEQFEGFLLGNIIKYAPSFELEGTIRSERSKVGDICELVERIAGRIIEAGRSGTDSGAFSTATTTNKPSKKARFRVIIPCHCIDL